MAEFQWGLYRRSYQWSSRFNHPRITRAQLISETVMLYIGKGDRRRWNIFIEVAGNYARKRVYWKHEVVESTATLRQLESSPNAQQE